MPRAILTGGPGAGKTTLLQALAAKGLKTAPESAREVIAERRKQELSPRPPPLEFAVEILRRDSEKYRAAEGMNGWTIYDRGAIEAIGSLHAIASFQSQELRTLLDEHRVERVFILPPWPEIYTTDEERDQTADEAGRVHGLVAAWYRAVGYHPIEVTRAPVAQRLALVLHALGAA
jgi:predicted ATPase